jgi:hypothetical protein
MSDTRLLATWSPSLPVLIFSPICWLPRPSSLEKAVWEAVELPGWIRMVTLAQEVEAVVVISDSIPIWIQSWLWYVGSFYHMCEP